MRINPVQTIVLALAVAFSTTAIAQKAPTVSPKYDVSKEVTIKGTIDTVQEVDMGKGELGVHLTVTTGAESIEVRLCPSGVLKDFGINFEKGQAIEVTGSKVQIEDKDVILAREVVAGNSTVILRDKHGAPVWTWMKKG